MKKTTFILALALALTFAANADDKQVIATVNGTSITRGEIEGELAQIAEMVEGGAPKLETFPKDFQKEFINKYIDKILIVQAAKDAGTHKSPEIIKKVQEAEDYLAQKKYLANLVMKQRSDKELKKIYDEKVKSKEAKTEVHASHILVATEAKAKELKKQIDGGADFEKLAMANSIEPGAKVGAGDLGYFIKEHMVPTFSEAAFKLKKNQISDPVKTDFGWHLIKLHDKRTKKQATFKEAKPALETEFARRAIQRKVTELRKSAIVDIKLDLEDKKKVEKKAAEVKKKEKPKAKAAAKPEAKVEAKKPKVIKKVLATTEKEAASGKE